jgi:glycosyltransferase involved in cell wall biosynthesis
LDPGRTNFDQLKHSLSCGGPEPGFDAVIEAAGKMPGVILPGYVNDNQLRWLYTHASGFVLPSLLEGFGLPAAEAISYGLIPLLSKGGLCMKSQGTPPFLSTL